jgi:tetratricopeptide (TPR) repeat protein
MALRFEEIERYAARVEREPGSRVFAQLADAYRKEGLQEEAIQICREGLITHPTCTSARVVLGRALLEQGSLVEAEAEFRRVLDQAPDNLVALRLLGDLSVRRDEPAEARTYYERALRLNPGDQETQERLAALPAAPAVQAEQGGAIPADPLASSTLAAIYASQGHAQVAEAMYAQLGQHVEQRPILRPGIGNPQQRAAELALVEKLTAFLEAARQIRK